jgi:tRNA (guanine-N7-)-methyltransferase
MGKKNKLKKFEELHAFQNVYENFDPKVPALHKSKDRIVDLKGKWALSHFDNTHPVILELACGRGEYTVALAKAFSQLNFIGVDIKGARIWQGAQEAIENQLSNAAFLRTRIEQADHFFAKDEISEIWITFPDPFLRESKENKRLTSARFLERYKKFLRPSGIIHLKTDDPTLYQFTLDTIEAFEGATLLYFNDDIYADELAFPELEYKTHYENEHLDDGRKIKYIRFRIH